jgi:hypothetical protein
MRNCGAALEALERQSAQWKVPLNRKSIANRLLQFERELASGSGGLPVS